MENLSTSPTRAGRDASGGKKLWLWMPLFSLTDGHKQFQNHSFKMYFLKIWDQFDPQNLRKARLIFCDTECLQYPLEDGECWQFEGFLNYSTVL